MNRLLVATISLFIVAGLCVAEYACIKNNTDKFIRQIESVEKAMTEGDRETALTEAKKVAKDWHDAISVVDMLLYHDYVDQIGAALSSMYRYIEFEEEGELFATCERAKSQLISLKESEKPTPANII